MQNHADILLQLRQTLDEEGHGWAPLRPPPLPEQIKAGDWPCFAARYSSSLCYSCSRHYPSNGNFPPHGYSSVDMLALAYPDLAPAWSIHQLDQIESSQHLHMGSESREPGAAAKQKTVRFKGLSSTTMPSGSWFQVKSPGRALHSGRKPCDDMSVQICSSCELLGILFELQMN